MLDLNCGIIIGMSIEGGEPKRDLSKLQESARIAFTALAEALHEIEGERTIDLNKPSIEPWAPELRGLLDKKDALEIAVQVLKADINYLDPKLRKQAEGMIIRAELYLAAHQSKPKSGI